MPEPVKPVFISSAILPLFDFLIKPHLLSGQKRFKDKTPGFLSLHSFSQPINSTPCVAGFKPFLC